MRVAVVGSGPAGSTTAKALLDQGHEVDILDFGNQIEPLGNELAEKIRNNQMTADDELKLRSSRGNRGVFEFAKRIVNCLLGRESMLELDGKKRLGSLYTFKDTDWGIPTSGKPVVRSLAKGGLSNVWGAACYPLTADEYPEWPVSEQEMAPHYREATRLMSVMQVEDDLAKTYPLYPASGRAIPLNPPAQSLLNYWNDRSDRIGQLGFEFGRTRLAVRVEPSDDKMGCQECGKCLIGCPYDSIYRASWTLKEMNDNPRFNYRPGYLVQSFEESGSGVKVKVRKRGEQGDSFLEYDRLFLAAGTLSSVRIAAESLGTEDQDVQLLDNDLYLVPFFSRASSQGQLRFSLNELAVRLKSNGAPVHIQLYCMNDQILDQFRPILALLPGFVYRWLKALLSRIFIGFVFIDGKNSGDMKARFKDSSGEDSPVKGMHIDVQKNKKSTLILRDVLKRIRKNSKILGFRRMGPIFRAGPKGPSGGHVSSGLPMSKDPGKMQTDQNGKLHGTQFVYVSDASTFPLLPAQNSTYTVVANAHRIGSALGSV